MNCACSPNVAEGWLDLSKWYSTNALTAWVSLSKVGFCFAKVAIALSVGARTVTSQSSRRTHEIGHTGEGPLVELIDQVGKRRQKFRKRCDTTLLCENCKNILITSKSCGDKAEDRECYSAHCVYERSIEKTQNMVIIGGGIYRSRIKWESPEYDGVSGSARPNGVTVIVGYEPYLMETAWLLFRGWHGKRACRKKTTGRWTSGSVIHDKECCSRFVCRGRHCSGRFLCRSYRWGEDKDPKRGLNSELLV
jgi:hypothetical protein